MYYQYEILIQVNDFSDDSESLSEKDLIPQINDDDDLVSVKRHKWLPTLKLIVDIVSPNSAIEPTS